MKHFYTVMFVVSITVLVASAIALGVYGLNFGVDFRGGSVLEVEFLESRPSTIAVHEALAERESLKELSVNTAGDGGLVIRSSELSEEDHQWILTTLRIMTGGGKLQELRFDSVGPAIGRELKSKSITAIVLLLVMVMLYIAYMFRTLSRSLSLLAMSAGTVLGLVHDIIIPMGIFSVLGHYADVQISAIYVAAVLTILGYTVSDKVVIYDRVRENILRGTKDPLPDIVHRSVMQTLVRSINNTLVVMLSSLAVFLYGGESIRYFALSLMLGIGLGAYSSIFVASPLLVWLSGWTRTPNKR